MIKETLLQISDNFKNLSNEVKNIEVASSLMIGSLRKKKKIIYCGNGGSAADSQHLAAELVGRYRKNRQALSAIALTTDTSVITAVGNDFAFDQIFSRQIDAIGSEDDILYAISTSGKSKNIIMAIDAARKKKMKVIGLTGEKENEMKDKCDIVIKVPANRPDRIQEMHIAVGQILCELIENELG